MSSKAIFLDRDGVVNRALVRNGKPYPPSSVDEMELVPDAAEVLAELKKLGFLLLVVTNQPDVARGTQQRSTVEHIHEALRDMLPIDDFFVCYHDDTNGCECRKPKPGLLFEAAEKHDIRLDKSFLIGDRWRDVEAGHHAGCITLWIDYGYRERGPSHAPSARVTSLNQACEWIIDYLRTKEQVSPD